MDQPEEKCQGDVLNSTLHKRSVASGSSDEYGSSPPLSPTHSPSIDKLGALPNNRSLQDQTTVLSPSRKWIRTILFLAVAGLLIVLGLVGFKVLSQQHSSAKSSSLHSIHHHLNKLFAFSTKDPECSGQGININGKCICHLGYAGDACQEPFALHELRRTEERHVLLVVDYFGPLDLEHENAIYYTTLATFMAKNGYAVSILQLGAPSIQWEALQKLYQERGIRLFQLEKTGLKYGGSSITENSYEIYQMLLHAHPQYGQVYWISKEGAGYYTMLASRQGLACFGATHFISIVDGQTNLRKEQIRKGGPKYSPLVTNPHLLRAEFMQQKTVEWSDTIIASSKILLDQLLEAGWRVPDNVYILPHLTVPVANERTEFERADELLPSRQSLIREFVFIGPLGTSTGLVSFVNSLDHLLSRDQKAHRKLLKEKQVRVTFWGPNDVVQDENGITGEHYLEMRAYAWGSRVKWSVTRDSNLKRLIKYLAEPGKGRVAIIPTLSDSAHFVLHQALRAGVPVLASNLRSAAELVHVQDRRDILFATNDTVALSKRMQDVWTNGVVIGRPQTSLKQYELQWKQLFSDLAARLPVPCLKLFELPLPSDDVPPLVSVILVHHNRWRLLEQAIEALEQQTFKNFEVVLVDDGSTDPEALKFLSDLSWRWWQERAWKVLREPNRYLGAARNTGAKHARGKYLLFMDDDDVAKPHQIEVMARVAETTGADVVTTGHDLFEGRNMPRAQSILDRYIPLGPAINLGLLENCFGDSSFLVHRQFFLDSGGFTEEYGVGFEDYEYLAKIVVRDNHLEAIPEPLHWYRQQANSMSQTTDLKANQARFMRAYLELVNYLPKFTQSLLKHVQSLFFTQPEPAAVIFFCSNDTTTTSTSSTSTTTTTSSSSTSSTTTTTTSSTTTTTTTTTSSTTTTTTTTSSTTTTTTTTTTTSSSSGRTCPCRPFRRTRTTSRTSSRATCITTLTVTPTIRRTCRAPTVVKTVTPTVTCQLEETDEEIWGPNQQSPEKIDSMDKNIGEEADQNGDSTTASVTTTIYLDAPPPIPPMAVMAEYSPGGEYIAIKFDRPVNVEVGRPFPCGDFFVLKPRNIPNAAQLPDTEDEIALSPLSIGQSEGIYGKDNGLMCTVRFVSPLEMHLRVGAKFLQKNPEASVQPGKLLIFRDNILANVDSLNRAFMVGGSIEVSSPANPIVPIVMIDGPSLIGPCTESLYLNLGRSVGNGGRPWVDAYLDFNSTTEVGWTETPLRQFLRTAAIELVKKGKMVLEIPNSLLTDYTSYTFQMTLWNVFGLPGTGTFAVSKVRNYLVPPITIEGPRMVTHGEAVRLLALLPPTNMICGRPFNATTEWSMIVSPRPMKLRNAIRPALIFDRDSLPLGEYLVSLKVSISCDLDLLGDAAEQMGFKESLIEKSERAKIFQLPFVYTHAFTVVSGPWQVWIPGGSRLVPPNDLLTLLGQVVFEDNLPDSGQSGSLILTPANPLWTNYEWKWTCVGPDRESPCYTREGSIIELGSSKNDGWSNRHANMTIDIRMMIPGYDFLITVHTRDKDTKEEKHDSVVIAISERIDPPMVEIDMVHGNTGIEGASSIGGMIRGGADSLNLIAKVVNSNVDPNDEIVLVEAMLGHQSFTDNQGKKHAKNITTYSFYWESLPICNGEHYSILTALHGIRGISKNNNQGAISTNTQTILPGLLSPGAKYCIRVTVINESNSANRQYLGIPHGQVSSGWAFIILQAPPPPSMGYCELDGLTIGTAYQSKFIISCHGWESDPRISSFSPMDSSAIKGNSESVYKLHNSRIRYRFMKRTRTDVFPLGPTTDKSSISVVLDPGHYQLEVEIYDRHGLVTIIPVKSVSARLPLQTQSESLSQQRSFEQKSSANIKSIPSPSMDAKQAESSEAIKMHNQASLLYQQLELKDEYLLRQVKMYESTMNIQLGHEIVALAATNANPLALIGLLPKNNQTTLSSHQHGSSIPAPQPFIPHVNLAKLLGLIDSLTLNTYIDIDDTGPYFIYTLLRLLPPKLPIDLRPQLLRILHRLVTGMARHGRSQGRCFDQSIAMAILHGLGPILENPRSGASASFVLHEVKSAMELCLQRKMTCSRKQNNDANDHKVKNVDDSNHNDHKDGNDNGIGQLLKLKSGKLDVEIGIINTQEIFGANANQNDTFSLCGFSLPNLRGLAGKHDPCLGYRCSWTRSNLMRPNSSIDHNVWELSFRNASMVLAPWFRTQSINFTIPLSSEFSQRIRRGRRTPKCVWYDRYSNATASKWSEDGCYVLGYNYTHVQCSCRHLTEFSILIPDRVGRPPWKNPWWWLLIVLSLAALAMTGIAIMISWRQYKRDLLVKQGKRLPRNLPVGPPTYEEHVRRRGILQRRIKSGSLLSSADTLYNYEDANDGNAKELKRNASTASTIGKSNVCLLDDQISSPQYKGKNNLSRDDSKSDASTIASQSANSSQDIQAVNLSTGKMGTALRGRILEGSERSQRHLLDDDNISLPKLEGNLGRSFSLNPLRPVKRHNEQDCSDETQLASLLDDPLVHGSRLGRMLRSKSTLGLATLPPNDSMAHQDGAESSASPSDRLGAGGRFASISIFPEPANIFGEDEDKGKEG